MAGEKAQKITCFCSSQVHHKSHQLTSGSSHKTWYTQGDKLSQESKLNGHPVQGVHPAPEQSQNSH